MGGEGTQTAPGGGGSLSRIGPYEILGILGQGGMGVVYRGRHIQTGEAVALKTVRVAEAASLASIRREIHSLSRLRHPRIVRIVAHGISSGLPWYAMDLLQGATLRDTIRDLWAQPHPAGEPPSLLRVLTLLRRLCAPLAFLHGMGLVHRDLKPENVFITSAGDIPVLVDLGIVGRFGGAKGREELEAGGKVEGSSRYMAPEQILGELVDARADLYALGCILYECVTGRLPFTPRPDATALEQHLHEPPLPPSSHVEGLSRELDHLVIKLLEKRPQNRLGYADDVAATLEALGAGPDPESGPRAPPYLYRPELTGRGDALSVLEAAVHEVEGPRRGGFILIEGESGVGKTRLVLEMARIAARRRVEVITGQCATLGLGEAGIAAAPLDPIRPLLLAVTDRCRQGGAAEADRWIGPRGKVLAPYEPTLLDLPGQRDQPDPVPLPPDAARARVIAALKETLFALAEERPLLFIIDDLQWADELTLSFLRALSEAELPSRPVLFVGTCRMEETRPEIEALGQAAGATRLRLRRLETASVGAMISGMLALPEAPRSLVELLTSYSDGNPFFIAEYLRAAIGEGMLTRDRAGRWRLSESARAERPERASLPLPGTLAELIERRLSNLPEGRRALAQCAAALGRELDGDLLMAIAGLDDVAALEAIEELRVRQIVEEHGPGRLRFVHDKIREIAYERTPEPERRALHRRAAEALERRGAGADELSPALGHHYSRAGVPDKASLFFTRAGDRARAAYAGVGAIAFYQAAISEAEKVPAGAAQAVPLEPIEAIHERLGEALSFAGRQEEARDAFMAALGRAPPDDRLRRARLLRKAAKTQETRHRHEEALETYAAAEDALGAAPGEGSPAAPAYWHEWIQIQCERSWVHYWLAQVDEMRSLVERMRPTVEARGTPAQRARFFQALVNMHLRRERYVVTDESVGFARASLAASLETGDPSAIALARFMLGFQLVFHDEFDEAMDTMLAALDEAEYVGDVTLQSRCLTYVMTIYRRLGRTTEAARWAERTIAVATAAEMLDYIGAGRANLAWVAWRGGDMAAAEARGRDAVDVWRQLSPAYPYPMQWMALLVLLALDLSAGRVAEGAQRARTMLDPGQQRLPDELAEALAGGEVAWARGDRDEARSRLEDAVQWAKRLAYL